jgi:hypothetical protein
LFKVVFIIRGISKGSKGAAGRCGERPAVPLGLVGAEMPRRYKRLERELLGEIVRATEGGQLIRSSGMKARPGWTKEQVWGELGELWDQGVIRAQKEPRDLIDPVGDPSLLIEA